ncbi:MAG: hypothetical protein CL678_07095 [Bdellovibrionaceae bacterium]|nr:hypothetical protein [Pseudobdellovibrionaceae bacterium]|tara:strand:+ start:699 stop:1448 length:750 start_codon:yes stop_codon:yes gene_type:complete
MKNVIPLLFVMISSCQSSDTTSSLTSSVLFSDDFLGASLGAQWSTYDNDTSLNVSVSGGGLHLTLSQTDLWFNAQEGPMLYQNVTGNFKVTASVQVRRASNFTLAPNQNVNLGGIIARDPDGSAANYVFIVAGRDVNDGSIETKNTAQGCSDFTGPTWTEDPTDAELRICRVGQVFYFYKRPMGSSTWEFALSYDRSVAPAGCPQAGLLPETLQVGPVIYAANGPDVEVRMDKIEARAISSQSDCIVDP